MKQEFKADTIDKLTGIGRALFGKYPDKRIFVFSGEMGAGKTTFIQALCRILDVADNVNSPTFSIINEYKRKNGDSVFHFDLYRVEKLSEVFDLGYEDYFYSGAYVFIEWPEIARKLLPENSVYIQIEWTGNDECRTIRF